MTEQLDVLQQVLDGTAPDTADARVIERDLERISRGMRSLADAPAPQAHRAGWLLPMGAAAAVIAVLLAGGVMRSSNSEGNPPAAAAPSAPDPTTTTAPADQPTAEPSGVLPGPAIGAPGPALSLTERVAQADRIVVGTVTKLDRGALTGPNDEPIGPYVLATVAVTETVKPASSTAEVVAFDYDYGGAIVSTEGAGKAWEVGQQLLLFLVSDAGTVSETLQPAHLQVAEGASGRYAVNDGRLDAPFTLDEVRRVAQS